MTLGEIAHLLQEGYRNEVDAHLAVALEQEKDDFFIQDEEALVTWLGPANRKVVDDQCVMRQLFRAQHIRNRYAHLSPMRADTLDELCKVVLGKDKPQAALLWRVLDLKRRVKDWAGRTA